MQKRTAALLAFAAMGFASISSAAGPWKHEASALLGLNQVSPDATPLFMLEYEF